MHTHQDHNHGVGPPEMHQLASQASPPSHARRTSGISACHASRRRALRSSTGAMPVTADSSAQRGWQAVHARRERKKYRYFLFLGGTSLPVSPDVGQRYTTQPRWKRGTNSNRGERSPPQLNEGRFPRMRSVARGKSGCRSGGTCGRSKQLGTRTVNHVNPDRAV